MIALPDLSTGMTIAGPGPSVLTVARNSASATPDFDIFNVDSSAIGVAISGLTITGGVVTSGASAMENAGAVTVTNCTLTNNKAYQPGVGNPSGAIFNTGTLSIVSSKIEGNSSSGYEAGAGVFNTGTMSIRNSSIADNSATYSFGTGFGGGIYNSGNMTVTGSTISGNSVTAAIGGVGGGIYNSGTMSISSSSIAGNTSFCGYGNNAGGIGNFGTMSITGSTISNNSASAKYSGMAGGIITQADLSIINSTISGNSLEVEYGSFGAAGITAYGTLTLSLTYVTIANNLNTIDPNFRTVESVSVELFSSTTVADAVDSIFDASGGESVYLGPALLSIPWGTTCSRTPLALPSMPRIRPTPTRCLGHSPITAARPSRRLSCPAAPRSPPVSPSRASPAISVAWPGPARARTSVPTRRSCLRPSSASSGTASIINARASS